MKRLRRSVLAVIVLNFAAIFIWSKFTTILPLFSEDVFQWNVSRYGIYLGSIGLLTAIIQGGFVGWLVRKLGHSRLVTLGFAFMGIGLLILSLPKTPGTLVLSVIGIATGFGVLIPTLPAMLSLNVHPERRGIALGVFQSASTLARVFAPLLAGILYDRMFETAPFIVAGGIGILVMVLMLVLSPKLKSPRSEDRGRVEVEG